MQSRTAPRETRAERSRRIREELITTAGRVFRRRGYHDTSLDRIAAEAGYTKGAVYSNFSGKDDLFLAIFDRQVEARFRVLVKAMEAGGHRAVAHRYSELIDQDPEWSMLMVEFTAHAAREPELRAALAQRNRALTARVAEVEGRVSEASTDPAMAHRISAATLVVASGLVVECMVDPAAVPESIAEDLILRFIEGEGARE